MREPNRHGKKPFSYSEDCAILVGLTLGMTTRDIAKVLRRSYNAVTRRRNELDRAARGEYEKSPIQVVNWKPPPQRFVNFDWGDVALVERLAAEAFPALLRRAA